MKKILFVASTLSHIENFHLPYLKEFKNKNYIVHVMGKSNNKSEILFSDKVIPINFEKNMFSIKNFVIALKIAKIIKSENYDIVNIHTSLAAFFVRLGIILSFNKPQLVVNTVHGYLFDDKSPLFKKAIMLLAEKFTKCITDIIIVMNSTDYSIAKKHKLYKKNIYLIKGMGINTKNFPPISLEKKLNLRYTFNLSKDDFILIYVAEFSKRKNQKFLLDSIHQLVKSDFKNIKLILIGDGTLLDDLKQYTTKLGIDKNVIFTGYTKSTCAYYQLSDICVSSSRSEGLPFNIMEAMSTGLPIIASNIKGHIDLVNPLKNGFLFEYNNINEFCKYIKILYKDINLRDSIRTKNISLANNYDLENVLDTNFNIIYKNINASNDV